MLKTLITRRNVTALLTATLLFGVGPLCQRSDAAEEENWAAIAYSPLTGSYGYAVGQDAEHQAKIIAERNCSGPDKRIVLTTKRKYIAYASGALGAGWGSANTAEEAKKIALKNCHKRAPLGTIKFCKRNH